MKRFFFAIFLIAGAIQCLAAEQHVWSVSPNQQFAIIEEQTDDGGRDEYFISQSSHKKLGFVLPADVRGEISNVAIIASWNPSSTKVALLLFYGTKLSELLLFSRANDGTFQPISLEEPNPTALYQKRTGKTLPQRGDGEENGVGPWLDENTVLLVWGDVKVNKENDDYLHLFVTFRAHIAGKHAELSHLKIIGPLTDSQSEAFLKKWGEQYVEAHD